MDSPDQQLSLTDPDARSTKCRDGGIVGYNVQTAVDAQHHLIVDHDVVTEEVDRDVLFTIALLKATRAFGSALWPDRGPNRDRSVLVTAACCISEAGGVGTAAVIDPTLR